MEKMDIRDLKEKLREIPDPRREWGNLRHKLADILVIALCSTLCCGEDFVDMEEFGRDREGWLREFLELPNGIPDSDTFRRVLERIEPGALSRCLNEWLETERVRGRLVNLDGKTLRGSGNSSHKAYHVVSAWVGESALTLGEMMVDEKTNEITAIPELLDMIDIEGDVVSCDAMGCQKDIAAKIVEKEADYVLALKGNQTSLHEDVKLYFENLHKICDFDTLEKGHGRIEKREYFLETNIGWLKQRHDWKGLRAIGAVRSRVVEKETTREETRYFITSLIHPKAFANAVRGHWSIENQLHWMLDVIFREDASRARKDNSPLNLNVLRKISLSVLRRLTVGRLSVRKKMLKAARDPDFLARLIWEK
jgi:predicted transposase YbfD/YdcC